jgi:hypothetical protein
MGNETPKTVEAKADTAEVGAEKVDAAKKIEKEKIKAAAAEKLRGITTPEQKETAAEKQMNDLEKEFHVIENFSKTIESYKDIPSNPDAAQEYNRLFSNFRAVMLAGLNTSILEVISKSRGATLESLFQKIQPLIKESAKVVGDTAARKGNAPTISLSELQLSEEDISKSKFSAAEKSTLRRLKASGDIYDALKKARGPEEKDTDEEKKRKEVVVEGLTRDYLINVAENIKAGGKAKGSGDGMLDVLQTVLSDTVGAGKLSLAKFEGIRNEIKSKYGDVLQNADSRNLERFEEMLDKAADSDNPEAVIIDQRVDMLKAAQEARLEAKSNPYGLFTRKYGELKWVLLFAAEKWIYATLGLNLLMHGTGVLKNPAFLGMAAAAGGAYVLKNPEVLRGKSENERERADALTEELKDLHSKNPEVANWLGLVSDTDLEAKGVIENLLATKKQKGEYWVSSKEIGNQYTPKKVHPNFKEILPGNQNPNGRKLYELLVKCQESKVNPSKLLEVEAEEKSDKK